MPPDIQKELAALEKKIDAVHASVEKTRKYFLWTLIITIIVLVLPLIGLAIALPSFLNTYSNIQDFTL